MKFTEAQHALRKAMLDTRDLTKPITCYYARFFFLCVPEYGECVKKYPQVAKLPTLLDKYSEENFAKLAADGNKYDLGTAATTFIQSVKEQLGISFEYGADSLVFSRLCYSAFLIWFCIFIGEDDEEDVYDFFHVDDDLVERHCTMTYDANELRRWLQKKGYSVADVLLLIDIIDVVGPLPDRVVFHLMGLFDRFDKFREFLDLLKKDTQIKFQSLDQAFIDSHKVMCFRLFVLAYIHNLLMTESEKKAIDAEVEKSGVEEAVAEKAKHHWVKEFRRFSGKDLDELSDEGNSYSYIEIVMFGSLFAYHWEKVDAANIPRDILLKFEKGMIYGCS